MKFVLHSHCRKPTSGERPCPKTWWSRYYFKDDLQNSRPLPSSPECQTYQVKEYVQACLTNTNDPPILPTLHDSFTFRLGPKVPVSETTSATLKSELIERDPLGSGRQSHLASATKTTADQDIEVDSYTGHWQLEEGRSPATPLRSSPVLGGGAGQALQQLHPTEMCKELSHPLPDIIEKTLDGLLDVYKEDSLAHRLKVFFVGDQYCGKSSLIASLVAGSALTVEVPTEGVNSQIWKPFMHTAANDEWLDKKVKATERGLILDVWDITGRQICQGGPEICYIREALYIVVFNLVDQASRNSVTGIIDTIQAKAPGSVIILAATRADKLFTESDRQERSNSVLQAVQHREKQNVDSIKQHITKLSQLSADPKILEIIEDLENLLQHRPKLPDEVHTTSNLTGKGLDALRSTILSQASDSSLFPHLGRLVKPGVLKLVDDLWKLSTAGSVLLSWCEFHDLALKEDRLVDEAALKQETKHLQSVGLILDLHVPSPWDPEGEHSHHVCVNPQALAHTICVMHVDDLRKSFKIEGRRFWPPTSGYDKPDPDTLVSVLEEIPTHGFIRESLLPLLWQDVRLEEAQLCQIVDLLLRLGLLMPYEGVKHPEAGLTMPAFKALSPSTRFYAPLFQLLPDNRPQLNWTPKPFAGDIQVNWRYILHGGYPDGMVSSLLAVCRRVSDTNTYCHCWKRGVLLKLGEAIICVQHVGDHVDICCRVNADEEGEEKLAVDFLWAQLCPFIHVTQNFFKRWPALYTETSLVVMGEVFYHGEVATGEPCFTLAECFAALKKGKDITFADHGVERSLNVAMLFPFDAVENSSLSSWIGHILSKRDIVLSLGNSTPPLSPVDVQNINNNENKMPLKQRKRNMEVKWNLSTESENKLPKTTSIGQIGPQTAVEEIDSDKISSNGKDNDEAMERVSEDKRKVWTEAEELLQAERIANGFVAATMATAVADYVKLIFEDNHSNFIGTISSAQVEAARATANAAVAIQSGTVDGAAKAVLDAVLTLQQIPHRTKKHVDKAKSTMCTVL